MTQHGKQNKEVGWSFNDKETLCEKFPNTKFFLVRIFPYLDWTKRFTEKIFLFSPNTGKYGLEKTPYLDIFHAVGKTKNQVICVSVFQLAFKSSKKFPRTLVW